MPMDRDEQRYFDDKFSQVHKRITDSERAQTAELHRVTVAQNAQIAEIKTAINEHKVESATHKDAALVSATEAARKAVESHRDTSWIHNPVKTWTLIGAIVGVAAVLGGLVLWIIKHVSL